MPICTVPFAWILGPGKEIYPDPLFALTASFYAELLKTRDITEALTVSGSAAPGISYFSMSAVGIFRIALAARIRGGDAEAKFGERAELLVRRRREVSGNTVPSGDAVEQMLRELERPSFDQHRRTFLALDQFPENESRFAITYDEVLAGVEAGDGWL